MCAMPDQQGHLRSLCGIYAVINAMNLVYPLKRQERVSLFKHLITTLRRDEYVVMALLSGTYKRHMSLMLAAAAGHMFRQQNTPVTVSPLFRSGKDVTIERYFHKLEEFLQQKNRAVIINLMGRLNHWSCVREVTKTSLLLEDSYGYHFVRKSTCYVDNGYYKTGHMIIPTQNWGISRQN